ncbi:chromosome segregation protein SMC [bacterium]|nr:chromosome segregation protein SMC [bacterium]
MHVVGLKIAGFKSFVDPVEIAIDHGLTGVVGPNGCGKSNVLEALRWAMGAASARAMRGEEMDDLIFAGSAERPAREIAEVTLILDNTDRAAPAEYNDDDRIEIRRTLRRGSGSSFRINGRSVRAKDVQLLFADASTGANSPALVRQGQISELIGARPQNRRKILEEAAGIGGLAARRHEAELKLQAADANLTRLTEVMDEIDRQIGQLKRQAQRARRHKTLSEEILALEAALMATRWRGALHDTVAARTQLAEVRQSEQEAASVAARSSTDEISRRSSVDPLRAAEGEAAGRLGALNVQLTRLEGERAAAEAALSRLAAEQSRLDEDADRERRAHEEALARVDRIREERATLPAEDPAAAAAAEADAQHKLKVARSRLETAESAWDSHRADMARAEIAAAAAALDQADAESRLRRLATEALRAEEERAALGTQAADAAWKAARAASEKATRSEEEAEGALRSAATAHEQARIKDQEAAAEVEPVDRRIRELETEIAGLDRLLRRIESGDHPSVMARVKAPGLERALAAALDSDLDAPEAETAPIHWSRRAGDTSNALPEGARPLVELVSAPQVLGPRLRQCGLVERAVGATLQASLRPGQRLVSLDGDLWRWDGFVRLADAPSAAAETLSQMTRREQAAAELSAAVEDRARLGVAFAEARRRLSEAESALAEARQNAPARAKDAAAAREALLRAEQEAARIAARSATLQETMNRIATERAVAEGMLAKALAALAGAPDDATVARGETLKAELGAARDAERLAAATLADLLRARESAERVRSTLDREETEWLGRAEAASVALADIARRAEAKRAEIDLARDAPGRIAMETERVAAAAAEADAARRHAADALAEAEAALRDADLTARTAREVAASAREAVARAEARLEAAVRREVETAEAARAAFGRELDDLEALVAEAVDGGAASSDAPDEGRLAHLKRERDALGAVNLEAEEQLAELSERVGLQTRERDDLVAAIGKLREGIEALNGEGRQRLVDAFEQVNEHFKSLFVTLFNGGEAELRLTESTDPLDAGLEIYACPPGKRMATLSLMSGGEQALTATALIFAVFLSRPAPICVLDEVDAPLDDANVDRYCRLLDEMRRRTETRFIVITHNAVSMSRMDRLFGVTMQERGVSRIVSVDLLAAERLAAA